METIYKMNLNDSKKFIREFLPISHFTIKRKLIDGLIHFSIQKSEKKLIKFDSKLNNTLNGVLLKKIEIKKIKYKLSFYGEEFKKIEKIEEKEIEEKEILFPFSFKIEKINEVCPYDNYDYRGNFRILAFNNKGLKGNFSNSGNYRFSDFLGLNIISEFYEKKDFKESWSINDFFQNGTEEEKGYYNPFKNFKL